MEVLGYPFRAKAEEDFIRNLLGAFQIQFIDQAIADTVVDIRKEYRIKLPDAIIAATAIAGNLDLVTRNISDYKGLGISVFNPFD